LRSIAAMVFEQIRAGGCLSYLIGCEQTHAGAIVDPSLDQLDGYVALATEKGLRIRFVIETHTHADHFSAARELAGQLGAHIVMHRLAATPFADLRVDDGEMLRCGGPSHPARPA
jgi:glyoxylase-like metal-dependent hydrolase (beta-lactamase superfamily II)